MNACERDPNATARTEWGAPEIVDEIGYLIVAKAFRREGCRLGWRWLASRLDDECPRAVASECLDEPKCVVLADAEVPCYDSPCFAFGEESVEKGTDDTLRVRLIPQGELEAQ